MTHNDQQPNDSSSMPASDTVPESTVNPQQVPDENVIESPAEDLAPGEPESTVGTGTSIALGCIAGTLLLIVFGLIFLAIVAIF